MLRLHGVTPSLMLACVCAAVVPAAAIAHGSSASDFRTRILSVEPAEAPVDVRMVKGDQIRFENRGDEDLLLCGYDAKRCDEWVRIGPDGVYEDRNSEAFYANSEGEEQGAIPEGAGTKRDFQLVRREPAFYVYHDHRVHWMGGAALPPNVDEGDSSPQKVFDGEVTFRYGDQDGVVRARLEYIGGRSFIQQYGEYILIGGAVLAMLVVFAVDARRRRRDARVAASAAAGTVEERQPADA